MNDPTRPPDAPAEPPAAAPPASTTAAAATPGWERATMERLLFATLQEQKA